MTTVPPPSQSDGFGFEHRPLVAVVEDPAIVEAIVDVYRSAFSKPPWNETEQQIEAYRTRLRADAGRPDARVVLARDASHSIVGFATAWTTATRFPTEPPWYATVADALGERVVNARMAGCVELDEIAVNAEHLGRGIGRRLLDAIAPLDGPAVWLATSRNATAAIQLYRAAGWDEITATAADCSEVVVFATPRRR